MKLIKLIISKIIFKLYFREETTKVNEKQFIDKYLKKRGYVLYWDTYTKGFVVIKLTFHSEEISLIEVWTDNISRAKFEIRENFSTGLILAENYFSRI